MQNNINQKLLTDIDALVALFNEVANDYFNKVNDEHNKVLALLKTNYAPLQKRHDLTDLNADALKTSLNFHAENLVILKTFYPDLSQTNFIDDLFNDINALRLTFLNQYANKLSESYTIEYLNKWRKGSFGQKNLCRIERFIYKAKHINNGTKNVFRKIGKKKTKDFVFPVRSIDVQYIINEVVFPAYSLFLQKQITEIRQALVEKNLLLFNFERQVLNNNYQFIVDTDLVAFEVAPYQNTVNTLNALFGAKDPFILNAIEKAGTLLAFKITKKITFKEGVSQSKKIYNDEASVWENTFFAIFEDWRFREHLYHYILGVRISKSNTEKYIKHKIERVLTAQVEDLISYTQNLLEELPRAEDSNKDTIRTFLKTKLYKLKKDVFDDDKNEATSKNAVNDIPNLLVKFDGDVTQLLCNLPGKVAVVKNPDFNKGIKKSEVDYFSPKDFIEFEFLPSFFNRSKSIQNQLAISLNHILGQYMDYDQVIDFYLDTSIALTDREDISEKQIIQVFEEGLQRLLKINNNVKILLEKIKNENLIDITQSSENLIVKLEQLDDSNNVFSIQVRMLKSKTKSTIQKASSQALSQIQANYRKLINAYNVYNTKLNETYVQVKQKLKIASSATTVSSEISNYLLEIERRVADLPVVYQHLFEIAPVKELNLFLSRTLELNQLAAAYNDFVKNNAAATLVIGENGSGKSSILNYHTQMFKSKYQVVNYKVTDFFVSTSDFYRLMNEVFQQHNISDDNDLQAYINSNIERRIIVIDGLERMFQRKVNGFACLQLFLSLVISSSHKFLWICSISQIAANYLHKAISLQEYFDHKIAINSLNKDEIKSIVLKRNRLSGYQIVYLDKDTANSEKLEEAEVLKQKQLEDNFFSSLNKFADSNISLSLYFWLQSIDSIENEIIYIREFALPDFSFLENISPLKSYALLNIMLHGKIKAHAFAKIANISDSESYHILSILKEDSILLFQNGYYTLNGFLFRHVVRILKNRNLIH